MQPRSITGDHAHPGEAGPIATLLRLPLLTGLTPLIALTQFTFACIAMGGFMFNQTLTIDEELGLFTTTNISSQGRFTLEVIRQVLHPPGILPLAPYLILAAAYIFAYNIILYLHGLRHGWKSQIGFLIFILFPTNWLIQEWASLSAALGVGLICSCLAAFLTMDLKRFSRSGVHRAALSVLIVALLVLSISTFQSQITLYLALGVGVTLFAGAPALDNRARQTLRGLGSWLIHAMAALLAYVLTTKLYLLITNQNLQHINTYFRNPYFMLRTEPLKFIGGNLEQFLRTYLSPGWFYGNPLWALTAITVGSIAIYMHATRLSQKQGKADAFALRRGWEAWASWLLLLATPLLLNLVSTPNRIPMRALFALPYVAWLMTMVWLELAARFRRVRLLQIGSVLACVLVLQSLIAISHYYAARAFSQRSDQLVASTIAAAMASQPSQAKPITQLLTKGALVRMNPYQTAWYSTAGASFFDWDQGSSIRIAAWLRAMGLPELTPVGKENSSPYDAKFGAMKAWPQPGSIQVVDQTLLVKLGP